MMKCDLLTYLLADAAAGKNWWSLWESRVELLLLEGGNEEQHSNFSPASRRAGSPHPAGAAREGGARRGLRRQPRHQPLLQL